MDPKKLISDAQHQLELGNLDQVCELLIKFAESVENELTERFRDYSQQYHLLKSDLHNKIINYKLFSEQRNQLIRSIGLDLKDIMAQPDPLSDPQGKIGIDKINYGRIIHNIPSVMPRSIRKECKVRIAKSDLKLLEGFNPSDLSKPETLEITDTMEVEIKDPGNGRFFTIESESIKEQIVEGHTHTQWVFYITPLIQGAYPLKIRAYLRKNIDGLEKIRELSFESLIEVVATDKLEYTKSPITPFVDSGKLIISKIKIKKISEPSTSIQDKNNSTTNGDAAYPEKELSSKKLLLPESANTKSTPVFKGVIFSALILIGVIVGSFFFNSSLIKILLTPNGENEITMLTKVEILKDQIKQQQDELNTLEKEIARMQIDSQNMFHAMEEQTALLIQGNTSNMIRVNKKMDTFQAQIVASLIEIDKLKKENIYLISSNAILIEEKNALTVELDKKNKNDADLAEAKKVLANEKEKLATENTTLAKKTNILSVVKVIDIDVNGYMIKSSGKEVDRNRSKSIDGLRICFNLTENIIAESGIEQFYVRIINPNGKTQNIENLGSGVLVIQSNNDEITYTTLKGVKYENKPLSTCTNWQPNIPFENGMYTVEVYNKGYLSGRTTFQLK